MHRRVANLAEWCRAHNCTLIIITDDFGLHVWHRLGGMRGSLMSNVDTVTLAIREPCIANAVRGWASTRVPLNDPAVMQTAALCRVVVEVMQRATLVGPMLTQVALSLARAERVQVRCGECRLRC